MMMLTSSGSKSSSIQLTDSEDQTENYYVGELYIADFLIGILHSENSTQNYQSELYTSTVLLRMKNTVLSAGNDVTPQMSADWIVHIT